MVALTEKRLKWRKLNLRSLFPKRSETTAALLQMWRRAWAVATVDACMEAPCRKTNHIPATNIQLNVEIGETSWVLARINLLFVANSLDHHQVQTQTVFFPQRKHAQRSFRMLRCCRWDIHQFTFSAWRAEISAWIFEPRFEFRVRRVSLCPWTSCCTGNES